MLVFELGEFGLIDRIAAAVGPAAGKQLLLGIGDDCLVWRHSGILETVTTDTMVDGVHFLRGRVSPADLGWKILAANLSDIGAMGATPAYALVTLGLPLDTSVHWVETLYAGMGAIGSKHGAAIAGGDIVRSATAFVSVTLAGTVDWNEDWRSRLLLRSAAKPGDIVGVSGSLGGSAGGLEIILERRSAPPRMAAELLLAHDHPDPPVALGKRLVEMGVRCGMDLSDGLAGDMEKICRASSVAARIDLRKLPVHPALAAAWPDDAPRIAATGGEDYQLLITASPAVWESVAAAGLPLTAIGSIAAGAPAVVFSGIDRNIGPSWDHFRLTE
jgi:thiamine-monophosphate kinase